MKVKSAVPLEDGSIEIIGTFQGRKHAIGTFRIRERKLQDTDARNKERRDNARVQRSSGHSSGSVPLSAWPSSGRRGAVRSAGSTGVNARLVAAKEDYETVDVLFIISPAMATTINMQKLVTVKTALLTVEVGEFELRPPLEQYIKPIAIGRLLGRVVAVSQNLRKKG